MDVIEGKIGHVWVDLEEEGQWLSNATSGTEDNDLSGLSRIMIVSTRFAKEDRWGVGWTSSYVIGTLTAWAAAEREKALLPMKETAGDLMAENMVMY